MSDHDTVFCAMCEHEYASRFNDDTGLATDPCPVCGHNQQDYYPDVDDLEVDASA